MALTQAQIEDKAAELQSRGEKGAQILMRTRQEFFETFVNRESIEDFIRSSVRLLDGITPGWKITVDRFLDFEGARSVVIKIET